VERIEKFGSSAKKDFFNSCICQKQTCFSKATKRKRLYAIARTFGLLGADG